MSARRLALIAVCTATVFTIEQALTFLPNIQVTVVLLILFSKAFSFKESMLIVFAHTFLDNLYMGSLNLLYFPAMLIGWSLIPICCHTFLKRVENPYILGVFGIFQASAYGFLFVIPNMMLYEIFDPRVYIIADIPFQILMAVSSFTSITVLYRPLVKSLRKLMRNTRDTQIEEVKII